MPSAPTLPRSAPPSTRERLTDEHASPTGRYGGSISTAELVAGTATPPESSLADDDDRGAVGAVATRRRIPVAVIGLVGVVIAFVGITSMFAFQQAPFYDSDEKAHLGYAHEIADFRLPEIERQPAVPESATQWQVERGTGRDNRYRAVWVANHPPLHYLAVAPLIWFAEATDRPDGGLLLMRFANLVFAAAGVVFTYLLATELSGGIRRVGLAAAAIVALVPQGHTYFSRGLNDGLAFAAGAGLMWAGVRCLRRFDRRNLIVLGAMATLAAGTRTATMLLAVVVVGAVVLDRLTRPSRRAMAEPPACGGDHIASVSVRPLSCSGGSTSASSCSMAISGRQPSCSSTSIAVPRGSIGARSDPGCVCGPISTTG